MSEGKSESAKTAGRIDLQRFLDAQKSVYPLALRELKQGQKQTHWMWFIFPQIAGLGFSATTKFFAIRSRAEAEAYSRHPILAARLQACAQALLELEGKSAREIMGEIDALKLRSSMTLFANVAGPESVFARVLKKFFEGKPDRRTLQLLDEGSDVPA